jgi:hypothetical protein
MAVSEVEIKSPSIPFFKGGIVSVGSNPSLEKRGRGDFQARLSANHVADFWHRTLVRQ